ncbi:MAG: methylcrotonoyl-CoA carboxylase, partial [Gammaproteobacteria bacterium]|nr:methylcrotonoyl-CoA carboxylase [Gammaproteobacteria bacterium]
MSVLRSSLRFDDPAVQANAEQHAAAAATLREQVAALALGGDERSRARHLERGKLLPRDRLETLLDPGTAFLELGQLAGYELYDDPIPGAGLITGVGRISGQPCMVVVNDATVKGGTYYPITVKKHLRAQEVAL